MAQRASLPVKARIVHPGVDVDIVRVVPTVKVEPIVEFERAVKIVAVKVEPVNAVEPVTTKCRGGSRRETTALRAAGSCLPNIGK